MSFAKNLQRDTLPNVTLRPAVYKKGVVCPAQHIDKTGCHSESVGVNLNDGFRFRKRPDRQNLIASNSNIGTFARCAGPVVYRPVADQNVIFGLLI